MNKSDHNAFSSIINKIDSPYLCDQLITLLEARRAQLRSDSIAYKPMSGQFPLKQGNNP